MDPVDPQAFRLRVQGHSWYQVADAIAEFSLATIRRLAVVVTEPTLSGKHDLATALAR